MAITTLGLMALPTTSTAGGVAPPPNTPPEAPVITAPLAAATIMGSATVSWTQDPDADGDTLTHFREHRAGTSGAWTRSSAVVSGHTWSVAALANGSYQLRMIASDGTAETASTIVTVTVANSVVLPASTTLEINGYDVFEYFVLSSPGGLEDGPFREWEEAQLYDTFGIRVQGVRVVGTRLSLTGAVVGTTPADRAARLAKFKWIIEKQQPAELVFGDDVTKYVLARHQSTRVVMPARAAFVQRFRDRVESEWILELPYRLDIDESVIGGITTTPVELAQGTGPVRPMIEIAGSATNPVLTLRDSDGNTVGSLTLTVSLATSSNKRIIDMELCTIQNEAGADRLSEMVTVGSDFFAILPEHSDYITGDGPTLTCSSGTATVRFRRAWL